MVSKLIANIGFNFVFNHRYKLNPGLKYFSAKDLGLDEEDYSFINQNKNKISVSIYYKKEITNNLVLFISGIFSSKLAYIKEINYLVDNGFTVFSLDQQGSFESEGKGYGGFYQLYLDCLEILKKITSDPRFKDQKVNIVGHSWGAYTTLKLVSKENMPMIKNFVALAAPISFDGGLAGYTNGEKIIKELTKIEDKKYPEEKHNSIFLNLINFPNKGLLIHSKDDQRVNFDNNFKVIEQKTSINKNLQFIELDGKNHNPTYSDDSVKQLSDYLKVLSETKGKKNKEYLRDHSDWNKIYDLDTKVMASIVKAIK